MTKDTLSFSGCHASWRQQTSVPWVVASWRPQAPACQACSSAGERAAWNTRVWMRSLMLPSAFGVLLRDAVPRASINGFIVYVVIFYTTWWWNRTPLWKSFVPKRCLDGCQPSRWGRFGSFTKEPLLQMCVICGWGPGGRSVGPPDALGKVNTESCLEVMS